METTYAAMSHVARPARPAVWRATRSACAAVGRAIAAAVRNDALDRVFMTSSSAQFAALPRREQNRLLDSGFRPR